MRFSSAALLLVHTAANTGFDPVLGMDTDIDDLCECLVYKCLSCNIIDANVM